MSAVETKTFSLEQANRMLPLVRKIIADILRAGSEMKSMSRETMTGDHASRLEIRISQLKSYLRELESLGGNYKDWEFKTGLVEFPGELNGNPVIFSWRIDEDSIRYYHRLDETHEHRRLLPA